MKTNEFIKKAEQLGYTVECDNSVLFVRLVNLGTVACVLSLETGRQYSLHMRPANFSYFIDCEEEREELYNLAVEYDKTPIEEREEKKKYYVRLKGANIEVMCCYLNKRPNGNFYFDDHVEQNDIQTKFTDEEILDLPIWVKDMLDDGYLIKEEAEDDF